MYQVLDVVGSVGYTVVTRFQSWVLRELCLRLTDASSLREAFLPGDWTKVRGFQLTAFFVTSVVFCLMQCILGQQRISILRISKYLLREHFWLLLWWLTVGLSYQVIAMDKRFDVDFSLEFDAGNVTRADN